MQKPISLPRPTPVVQLLSPVTVTLLACLLLLAGVIARAGGDPLELARLGTRFSLADPQGSEGYDGQFVYYIARDPSPASAAPVLDVPAYRYQRILLPLLARLVALGSPHALPWAIPAVGLVAHAAGVWAVAQLLAAWGRSRWYALVYGLWPGFLLALRLDLPEALAYALVAGALLAGVRGRRPLSWILYGLALFAKEVTLLFVLAQLVDDLLSRRWRAAAGLLLVSLAPYAVFQAWLWVTFGQPGLASGGAMATPFEIIPFMGLFRIGSYSLVYLGAMLLVFGPAVVLPSLWGVWKTARTWLTGDRNVLVFGLLLNSLAIIFLPFSTFREPGGLLRFASGLVLGVLLCAARDRHLRVLNYSTLWLVLNVFLLK